MGQRDSVDSLLTANKYDHDHDTGYLLPEHSASSAIFSEGKPELSLDPDPSKAVTLDESAARKRERLQALKRRKTRAFAKEMISQTVPMLALSCFGSVLAGEMVARFKVWVVFQRVPELFILVPILLNLKGNIEMNLAARFSTSANIGELDIRLTRRTLVIGNLALLQVQALLVSFIAGIIAFVLGIASHHTPLPGSVIPDHLRGVRSDYFECLLVLCASMLAASLSSAVVGSFMCALVICSRKLQINPDNIATPLAASLGDLLSLTVLGLIGSWFINIIGTFFSTVIFVLLLLFVVLNIWITLRNAYVQELLFTGWVPLILAMVISSGTGLVLEQYVNVYKGYGLMSPVVTGVAGNVGAILVSRISTSLHSSTFQSSPHTLTGIVLFVISTPVLCAFLGFAVLTNQVDPSIFFTFLYILVCVTSIALALGGAYVISVVLWKFDFDPDSHALPLMSSSMDVVGQLCLAAAFMWANMGAPAAVTPPALAASSSAFFGNITSLIEAR